MGSNVGLPKVGAVLVSAMHNVGSVSSKKLNFSEGFMDQMAAALSEFSVF